MPETAPGEILTLSVEVFEKAALVRCKGRLVAGETARLRDAVKDLLPQKKRIVLDLAELVFMDSTGIGTMVQLLVTTKTAGTPLSLANLSKPVRQMLGVTNLLSAFSIVGENGGMIVF